jgi:hypothetical protein
MNPPKPEPKATLHQLYPHLTEAQLVEAGENLKQYVALALRVFEGLEQDPKAMARFEALTASRRQLRMNDEKPQNQTTEL